MSSYSLVQLLLLVNGCQDLSVQGSLEGLIVGDSVGVFIVVTVPKHVSFMMQSTPLPKANCSQHCSLVSNMYRPLMLGNDQDSG